MATNESDMRSSMGVNQEKIVGARANRGSNITAAEQGTAYQNVFDCWLDRWIEKRGFNQGIARWPSLSTSASIRMVIY